MITQYFPRTVEIKARLEEILKDEITERTSLGLETPDNLKINLLFEWSNYWSSIEDWGEETVIHLNLLSEITQDPQSVAKYQEKIAEMDQWITNIRSLVAPCNDVMTGHELYEVLENPDVLDEIELQEMGLELEGPYENISDLKAFSSTMKSYISEIADDVAETSLIQIRSILRHEIEHTNPEFAKEFEAYYDLGREIVTLVQQYQEGKKSISTEDANEKITTGLETVVKLFPDDEARAFIHQYFDENFTVEDLHELRNETEQMLNSEYLPNHWKPRIFTMIVAKYLIESVNQDIDFSRDTINAAQNIAYTDTKLDFNAPVDISNVDQKLVERMVGEVNFWENKCRDEITLALDRTENFYAAKLQG